MFGFSQYVLSQIGGHLFLLFIFPVPLAIYLVLLRLDGVLGKYWFMVLLILVMTFEFLSSTELFATTTVFGTMALALSIVLCRDTRARLTSVISDIGLAYAMLALILSPYLYHVLVGGVPQVLNSAAGYSNDLLAFVVPTPVLLGGNLFAPTSYEFKDVWTEMAGYLGPGAWLIMVLFVGRYSRTKAGQFLLLSFGLIAVASLGPRLHIAGTPTIRLPWLIADRLPLINLALPGRFGMYLSLVAGVIVALYLSSPGIAVWAKGLLAACALVFIVPNLAFINTLTTRVDTPAFFRFGEYRRYISQDDIILILPDTINSTSQALLWQAQTDFHFRSATGFYLPPEDYQRWPITASFVTGYKIPDFAEQLDAFLGAHQVKAIIVNGAARGRWPVMLSEAGMTSIATGGVLFYKVPPHVLESFHTATAHPMAQRAAAISFGALLIAANRYIDERFPLAKLHPAKAYRLRLLNVLQDAAPPVDESNWWRNLWLGSWSGLIGVGVSGNFEDLKFLTDGFGAEAARVFFPFPQPLAKGPKRGDGQLLFLFTPEGLRRAASKTMGPPGESNENLLRSFKNQTQPPAQIDSDTARGLP
jgi:hypothetical protein